MNTFTAICNLCRDPEELTLGEKQVMKLRLADNTPGKNNETRYFGAIVSGIDVATAKRLATGDAIMVTGQLVSQEYTAKKDGKGVKKGQKVKTDEMPFAKIMQVVKSPTFFGDTNTAEPDLGSEPAAAESSDSPLDDVF